MLVNRNGKVWFGTEGGISVYDGKDFRSLYCCVKGLIDNTIDRMIEDKDGNIWAATVYGLVRNYSR